MSGYRPSAFGEATNVRIGEPGKGMSAYWVVTIIYGFARNSERDGTGSQLPRSAERWWRFEILTDFEFGCSAATSEELRFRIDIELW